MLPSRATLPLNDKREIGMYHGCAKHNHDTYNAIVVVANKTAGIPNLRSVEDLEYLLFCLLLMPAVY